MLDMFLVGVLIGEDIVDVYSDPANKHVSEDIIIERWTLMDY